jgi:hypothetical protein
MDTESIIASALDIIADESTLKNEMGEILQIRSADENIQKILYNLFYDILNIEFNLWLWTRNMCKYGDFYLHMEVAVPIIGTSSATVTNGIAIKLASNTFLNIFCLSLLVCSNVIYYIVNLP